MSRKTAPLFANEAEAVTGLSGYADWRWNGAASFTGWVGYALHNARVTVYADGYRADNLVEMLSHYLRSAGERESLYGVGGFNPNIGQPLRAQGGK